MKAIDLNNKKKYKKTYNAFRLEQDKALMKLEKKLKELGFSEEIILASLNNYKNKSPQEIKDYITYMDSKYAVKE